MVVLSFVVEGFVQFVEQVGGFVLGQAEVLAGQLLEAVRTFAQGAPQGDDVTMVLVKREVVRRAEAGCDLPVGRLLSRSKAPVRIFWTPDGG